MKSIDLRKYAGKYEVFVEQADGDFIVQTFAAKKDAEKFIENLTGQATELSRQFSLPSPFSGFYDNRDLS